MLKWISENIGTVIVCAALIAAVVATALHMIKQKRRGESSCGCNCAECSMSGSCHKS